MTKATEQDILDFVSELEAEPAPDSLGLASLAPGNDIPAKREKLAILVSSGKSKEVVGAQLTHEQVKRLSDKEVEKYHKRQEAYIGSKTTESLIDSFLMLIITTKHVQLEKEPEPDLKEPATHPSRDKEGYPLEGLDEV